MAKKHFTIDDPKYQIVEDSFKALAVGIVAVYPDGRIPEPSDVLKEQEYVRQPAGRNTIYVYHPGETFESQEGVQRIAFRPWVDWRGAVVLQLALRRTMSAPYMEAARATEAGTVITFDNPPDSSFTFVNLDLHSKRAQFTPVSFRVDGPGSPRYFTLGFDMKKIPIVTVSRIRPGQAPGMLRRRVARRG